jgi:PEP-CTERM motif
MMKYLLAAGNLMFAATISTSAIAQGTLTTRTVPIIFTGTVSNDVARSIKIKQPDGSLATFNGPVPDYPYKPGDQVSISFDVVAPTRSYYDPATGSYTGQVAADGIYRIVLNSNADRAGPGGTGLVTNPNVTGPIDPISPSIQSFGYGGMELVYDSNADTYSLSALPNATSFGIWGTSSYDGPSYAYDPSTGTVQSSASVCPYGPSAPECNSVGFGAMTAIGDFSTARFESPIFSGPAGNGSTQDVGIWGSLLMTLNGSWNLPNVPSRPTQVPEPGMMILFGGATAVLMRKRRQQKAA